MLGVAVLVVADVAAVPLMSFFYLGWGRQREDGGRVVYQMSVFCLGRGRCAHNNGHLNRCSRAHEGEQTSAVEPLGCAASASTVSGLLPGTIAEPAGVEVGVEAQPGPHRRSSSEGNR